MTKRRSKEDKEGQDGSEYKSKREGKNKAGKRGTSKNTSFSGGEEKLKGFFFNFGSPEHQEKFTRTVKEIKRFMQPSCKHLATLKNPLNLGTRFGLLKAKVGVKMGSTLPTQH